MVKLYAGLDVSKSKTHVCIVDAHGLEVFSGEASTTPQAIAVILRPYRRSLVKAGHETGLMTPWLHKELLRLRVPAICLDARQTRAALVAQRNKTDRNDARDIAIALSRGFNRTAYVKSDEAHEIRMLLTCRRTLQRKAHDIKGVLRTTLAAFGAKLIETKGEIKVAFAPRRRHQAIVDLVAHMLASRVALLAGFEDLDARVKRLANADPICRRLMTAPGVGPITALTFRAAVDDPSRFSSSAAVAAHFGLTPKRFQSGQTDRSGRISRFGDAQVRTSLYEAASVLIVSCKKMTRLRAWALAIRKRKGFKHACVACARKLAVILHRMWITETDFIDATSAP